jgi:hypothetical protein
MVAGETFGEAAPQSSRPYLRPKGWLHTKYPPIAITSTVTVTAPLDVAPGDNAASAVLPIVAEIPQPAPKV